MIVTASVLVINDDQQRLVPRRTVAQSVINIVDELLTKRNVVIRMLAIPVSAPGRLEKTCRRPAIRLRPRSENPQIRRGSCHRRSSHR